MGDVGLAGLLTTPGDVLPPPGVLGPPGFAGPVGVVAYEPEPEPAGVVGMMTQLLPHQGPVGFPVAMVEVAVVPPLVTTEIVFGGEGGS